MTLSSIDVVLLELASLVLFLSILAASVFLTKPFGHCLRISGIGALSLHGIRYTKVQTDVSVSISSLHFAFSFPRPSNPRWGTFTAHGFEHKDSGCHFSLHKIEVALWFFPVLFRFSAGPWLDITLDDFKLRVFSSTVTPNWVQRMRRNLVAAVLKGEILRLDDFVSSIEMSSLTCTAVADGQDSSAPAQKPGVIRPDIEDDLRVSAKVKGYNIINWQYRIYSFGELNVQLRRSWVDERGSFVLIARESKWTKVSTPSRREELASQYWLW